MRNSDVIHVNKTAVKRQQITILDWGIRFFTETELDAYKAAYAFNESKTRVEFAVNVSRWMVTVFNATERV